MRKIMFHVKQLYWRCLAGRNFIFCFLLFLSLLSSTFGFSFCLLEFSLLHSPLSLSLLFLSLLHLFFYSAFDWQSYIFFLNNESVDNGLLGKWGRWEEGGWKKGLLLLFWLSFSWFLLLGEYCWACQDRLMDELWCGVWMVLFMFYIVLIARVSSICLYLLSRSIILKQRIVFLFFNMKRRKRKKIAIGQFFFLFLLQMLFLLALSLPTRRFCTFVHV